jgi:hypothetical protein
VPDSKIVREKIEEIFHSVGLALKFKSAQDFAKGFESTESYIDKLLKKDNKLRTD